MTQHACETPLVQGGGAGDTWACRCGRSWTLRHAVSGAGTYLTWSEDQGAFSASGAAVLVACLAAAVLAPAAAAHPVTALAGL
jgi:hypothetical protein